eukprot:65050_1
MGNAESEVGRRSQQTSHLLLNSPQHITNTSSVHQKGEINCNNKTNDLVDVSALNHDVIKDKLRKEMFKWPRDDALIMSYVRALCRNCADGKCKGCHIGFLRNEFFGLDAVG